MYTTVEKLVYMFIIIFDEYGYGQYTDKRCSSKLDKINRKGVFNIIGLFPIKNEFPTEFDNTILLWSEVMKYTVSESNRQFAPRELFGYTLYDTCGPEQYDKITSTVLDIVLQSAKRYNSVVGEGECLCLPKNLPLYYTLGIVGPAYSSNSIYVNKLLSFESLPMISYASTSEELSNSTIYPYFYRTIPADYFQAHFITDILVKFKWTYVSILATDNSYGRAGMEILNEAFREKGICVCVEETFQVPYNKEKTDSIITKLLAETSANVTILWGTFQVVKPLLEQATVRKLYNKIWIISEAAGRNPWFLGQQGKLHGTFLHIVPVSGKYAAFKDYFFRLNYNSSINNPWLRTFFNNNGVNSTHNTKTMASFKNIFDFSSVGFVRNAVLVLINALLNYAADTTLCDLKQDDCITHINDHTNFNEKYVKTIQFKGLDNETIHFNLNGDINVASYELYTVTTNKNHSKFKKVAYWHDAKNGTLTAENTLLTIAQSKKSRCSESCSKGQYPIYNAIRMCCWECLSCQDDHYKPNEGQELCTKCPDNHVSNNNKTGCIPLKIIFIDYNSNEAIVIYAISAVGIFTTLLIIFTFIKQKETPIVKSSNFDMSIAQLIAHLVLFAVPLLFLRQDTKMKCSIRTYGTGFLFIFIAALTLVKITHILRIFKLKYVITKKEAIQHKTTCILIVVVAITLDVCLVLILIQTHPLEIKEIKTDIGEYIVYKECTSDIHYLAQVAYIILLQLVTGVQAFRGRKLPAKFNEAKYIAFAMFSSTLIMIIALPLLDSRPDLRESQLILSVVTVLANLVILIILYGYKIILIFLKPDQNTVEVFNRERMQSVLILTQRKISKMSNTNFSVITNINTASVHTRIEHPTLTIAETNPKLTELITAIEQAKKNNTVNRDNTNDKRVVNKNNTNDKRVSFDRNLNETDEQENTRRNSLIADTIPKIKIIEPSITIHNGYVTCEI